MRAITIVVVLACFPITGFVDRIEAGTAVVLSPDGSQGQVRRRCLPAGAREGTVLFRGRIDGRATRRAAEEARDLLGAVRADAAPARPP